VNRPLRILTLGLAALLGGPALAEAQPNAPEAPAAAPATAASLAVTDWPGLAKYRAANAALPPPAPGRPRVVFLGDSITELWAALRPGFFADHGYVGRGTSGQTTGQMVLRFHQDVAGLHPAVVVILAGTNDFAGNTGPETDDQVMNNLEAMVEMAHAHRIKVVIGSVPPATRFDWRPAMTAAPRIAAFDVRLKAWAKARGLTYADYWSAMGLPNGEMNPAYSRDTVHPNPTGYAVMEPIAAAAVAQALKTKP
jgi:lysophospholipase L1-like esterase